ncbi:energy-coupling factor transporter transmembrane component T family protein [Pseudonocardia nigra]|uniref:energy-coupling factor transporter transmembrane component T family protein n=1 Tax=Pseudonocardia nigra TaxID=1921578 RepID=UPI001C5FD0C3|nr:energy-coupling factor transporter transmembrane protein EcfT [Pseudonocardia nigra]
MSPLGLYEPGTSPLHRAPTTLKFLGVLVLAAVPFVPGSLAWPAAACVVVAAGYAVARIPARRVVPLVRGLLVVVALVFALQAWLLSPREAALTSLRLVAAIGAATLFTLTTRIEAVISAVERGLRPLRRFGVRPERVGLLVGLTLQAVSTLSEIARSVREAARARGVDRSVVAFAVPFLVRTLRHADELGEALAARGAGDDA